MVLCLEVDLSLFSLKVTFMLARCSKRCVSQSYRRVKKRIDQCESLRDEIVCLNNKLKES